MANSKRDFKEILEDVQRSQKTIKTYPYVATDYLGVSRRGWRVVERINQMLEKHEAICEPDFGSAWFYGEIEIKPKPRALAGKAEEEIEEVDPTPRLSLLRAANLKEAKDRGQSEGLISVNRDALLSKATTLMLLYDFSQLPVLSGEREVDGIISWKSIGKSISLGKQCDKVADCIDNEVITLDYDEPLFDAVKYVLEKEVVLVRQKDKTISGIVTVTDIGEQFISMAEPFLIIEQIENHIRKLLDKKFTIEELNSYTSHNDTPKAIKHLSDLTFGQYIRIIEDPNKFEKLNLNIDKSLLSKQLEQVRKIRNDVMHFDPDGITEESKNLLRQTVSFLHKITTTLRRPKKR